jgi:hypothetical protein
MTEPTQAQQSAAKQLDIDLSFHQAPINIARLAELVADLQRRVEQLEGGGNGAGTFKWRKK